MELSGQVGECTDPRRGEKRSPERKKSFPTAVFSLQSACSYHPITHIFAYYPASFACCFSKPDMSVERRELSF